MDIARYIFDLRNGKKSIYLLFMLFFVATMIPSYNSNAQLIKDKIA